MKASETSNWKTAVAEYLRKKSNMPYFNRWIIFLLDVAGSVIATFLTVFPDYYGPFHANVISHLLFYILASVVASVVVIFSFSTHKGIIRHSTIKEFNRVSLAMLVKVVLLYSAVHIIYDFPLRFLFMFLLIDWVVSTFLLISFRSMMVNVYHRVINPITFKRSAWVYGDMGRSISLITFLNNGFLAPYAPTRVIARGEHKRNGMRINDVPVRGFDSMEDIDAMMSQGKPNMIIFPDFASVKRESDELVEYCLKNNIEMMVAPDYEKMTDPAHARKRIREIRIEDLLGRNVITLPMESVKTQLEGKVVMVTGAAGSIGSEIARQLSKMNLKELILFDNAESPLHNIRLELEASGSDVILHPVIGDVRASKRLKYIFEKYHPQYIFHAAAYKHVPLMEENPCESVGVNVKGTRQLALLAMEYGVEKFVMVSTDKAVNPTNVMGATKRVAEMMVQTLDAEIKKSGKKSTKFITTRFGNVLGSNGSVIPLFRKQIEEGGPVTVTHPDIIRYFMTIPEACSLVLEAGTMGNGGEIFAFDMGQPMKIDTLARRMIKLAGFIPDVDIPIVYRGLRPGEKLYEEVLNEEETTLPTPNPKIRIAQVRECDPQEVTRCVDAMIDAAKRIEVMESVKAIKELVPEYLSKNSPYEVLDKKQK